MRCVHVVADLVHELGGEGEAELGRRERNASLRVPSDRKRHGEQTPSQALAYTKAA